MLILKNHVLPKSGESNELHENDIQDFVLEKLEGGLNMKSVKDILTVLRMVVKFGMKNKWMDYYEWDIKYPVDVTGKKLEVLSVANHKEILDYIQGHFSFPGLGVYISLNTGLHIGEIYTLKWSGISVYNGVLTANRTIERIYIIEGEREHTELVINTPRAKDSCREIPINKELLTMLKPLKKVINGDHYILTSDECPTEPHTYRNYCKRFMEKLNIPKLKYRGLRRSLATRCIEVGCGYRTVSVLLGHLSISTTLDLYVRPNMGQKKRCISKVFKSLGK